jgi:hypothetical protein
MLSYQLLTGEHSEGRSRKSKGRSDFLLQRVFEPEQWRHLVAHAVIVEREEQVGIAVFRPSNGTSYLGTSGAFVFGGYGDIPVPGDYNGDGTTDIAVFRPSNGTWYLLWTSVTYTWGGGEDIPVPGDYDVDGTTYVAVFRPSNGTWYIIKSSTSSGAVITWGGAGDTGCSCSAGLSSARFSKSVNAWTDGSFAKIQ